MINYLYAVKAELKSKILYDMQYQQSTPCYHIYFCNKHKIHTSEMLKQIHIKINKLSHTQRNFYLQYIYLINHYTIKNTTICKKYNIAGYNRLLELNMSEINYDFTAIEEKWQKKWEENKSFKAKKDNRPKYYILEMFPYPSGRLHMGHVRNYSIGDLAARFYRLNGYNVFHPIGWDSFGLPAENAAIKNNIPPFEWTRDNIEHMKVQCKQMGWSYDWDRELATFRKEYYKWNQWFFTKMLEKGLAYKKESSVNWCPDCNTVLANEQVEDGKCWRCKSEVDQKKLEQWFFKITDYAQDLLDGHEELKEGWPERVITMQKNWIGRSEGLMANFKLENGDDFPIFTTRPDTIFGVTFMVIAPEHPLLENIDNPELQEFITKLKKESVIDRTNEEKEKEGMDTGLKVINPFNGEKVPLYVGNFVLMEYGTGAIMAVPTHDKRDFKFAKKFNIPMKVVIDNPESPIKLEEMEEAYVDEGILVNSGKFDGLKNKEAISQIIDYAEKENIGEKVINYRLRDWGISRQRYWGCPIPIVYCEKCGAVPVPEDQLPVELPTDVDFQGSTISPLTKMESFFKTSCPKCGGEARRETDTMDTFVDSSWYFTRYTSSDSTNEMINKSEADYWTPVDQYIGGIEHACMHLLYARFFNMVMHDMNLVPTKEPFKKLLTQGMVTKDGAKMSKSLGNTVDPDSMCKKFGADTVRLFILFAAPPEKDLDWSEKGVEGCYRFVSRIWRFITANKEKFNKNLNPDSFELTPALKSLRSELHKTIKFVTHDVKDRMQYNTAIARMMELTNALYSCKEVEFSAEAGKAVLSEIFEKFLIILNPFVPHLTEELWEILGGEQELVNSKWPDYIEELTVDDEVEVVFQVNGKIRSKMKVAANISKQDLEKIALEDSKIQEYTTGKNIFKVIVVPKKLVNIVVK